MQYVVKSGDSLSKIAQAVYGDMNRWPDILAANPEITNPNLIHVGQTIKIPESGGQVIPLPSTPRTGGQTIEVPTQGGTDWMKIALIGGAVVLGYFVIQMIASQKQETAEPEAEPQNV